MAIPSMLKRKCVIGKFTINLEISIKIILNIYNNENLQYLFFFRSANAETGSGKTATFALPILQDLSKDPYGVFAIVLTANRELAM